MSVAVEERSLSQGRIVLRKFFGHRGALVGLALLLAIALLAFTSVGGGPLPGWWRHGWLASAPQELAGGAPTLTLPTWLGGSGFQIGAHPFGQDEIGRDMFARTMRGVQTSLLVMVLIGLVATVIGVAVGSLSGYFGGPLDTMLMRATDLVITFPTVVIGAVLGRLVAGTSPLVLALMLGLISWTGLARLVRGDFIMLRSREFVDAARIGGASWPRVVFRHVLPNAMGVVIVNVSLLMSSAILLETALSYLGFGITAPEVSLGALISEYQSAFATRPWLFWWPGCFIVLIALSVNLIGDGLRDAFDPRQIRVQRRRPKRSTRRGRA